MSFLCSTMPNLEDFCVVGCPFIFLALFDMEGGGGMMAPQNVFHCCVQTIRRKKLKLCDF